MKIYLTVDSYDFNQVRFHKLKRRNGWVDTHYQFLFITDTDTKRDYVYRQYETKLNLRRMSRFD